MDNDHLSDDQNTYYFNAEIVKPFFAAKRLASAQTDVG
jgi:hypothetical protein